MPGVTPAPLTSLVKSLTACCGCTVNSALLTECLDTKKIVAKAVWDSNSTTNLQVECSRGRKKKCNIFGHLLFKKRELGNMHFLTTRGTHISISNLVVLSKDPNIPQQQKSRWVAWVNWVEKSRLLYSWWEK